MGELKQEPATLHHVLNLSENKKHGLESQVASHAKVIAHLALLVKYHRLNYLRVTAKTVLRKHFIELRGKALGVVATAVQLHAYVSSMTE